MPRPKSIRKISGIPSISGFKPYGLSDSQKKNEAIFLLYEEYEAFRLCDYEKYNQQDAAVFMGVSRPTLTRIYISAREKIATAMIEGRKIIIEGGKVELDNEWIHCLVCGCYFTKNDTEQSALVCSLCGSTNIEQLSSEEIMSQAEKEKGNTSCGRGQCRRRRCKCGNKGINF